MSDTQSFWSVPQREGEPAFWVCMSCLSEAFYRKVPMPKGVFRGIVEDIAQPAVINVLVTHERISEDIVHDMAKTIVSNLDKLPEINPLFKGLKDLFEPLRSKGVTAFEFGGVQLHSGAIRAFRESGWLS